MIDLLAPLERRFSVTLSADARAQLLEGARVLELEQGQSFLHAGASPDHVGLVLRGAMHEVLSTEDGLERTCGFAFEGDLVGSYADALQKRLSGRRVEALSPTRLLSLSIGAAHELALRDREAMLLLVRVTEMLYVRKANRERELLTLDAMGRYMSLLREHPELEDRVALLHIASFLGITPVHLSRLRRRLRAPTATRTRPRG